MSDDDALFGELGARIPCRQTAASLPAVTDDVEAASGHDTGYVATTTNAATEPAFADDASAIFGHASGYVAAPCLEFDYSGETILQLQHLFDAGVQPWSKFITRKTGEADLVEPLTFGAVGIISEINDPPSDGPYEQETRTFAHHEFLFSTPTHARLQTRITATYGAELAAGIPIVIAPGATPTPTAPMPYRLYDGIWGASTPTWDSLGTLIHEGTLTVHETGPTTILYYEDIDIRWPLAGNFAQFVVVVGDGSRSWLINAAVSDTITYAYEQLPLYPDFPSPRNAGQLVEFHAPGTTTFTFEAAKYNLTFYAGGVFVP